MELTEQLTMAVQALEDASRILGYDLSDLGSAAHSPDERSALARIMRANREAWTRIHAALAQLRAEQRAGRED